MSEMKSLEAKLILLFLSSDDISYKIMYIISLLDIPNDSGSFSIAGDEAQEFSNKCNSVTTLPTHLIVSSKSCSGISSAVSLKT